MMIKVGDKVPSATLMEMKGGSPYPIKTDDMFSGKKVVLFALPGAFTPTCSAKHVPGFVQHADELRKKGVDSIACVSVNDAFVMGAWGEQQKSGDKVMMLADGMVTSRVLSLGRWTRPSSAWASAASVILDGHRQRRGKGTLT